MLLAASIVGLYAFVRLFDLRRRNPAAIEAPQRIQLESGVESDVSASHPVDVPVAAAEPQVVSQVESQLEPQVEPQVQPQPSIREPEVSEPSATRTGAGRRKGGSRKTSGRRAASPKASKVVPLAAPKEPEALEPAPEEAFEEYAEEVAHSPVTPLFEPEPYVRMPRQAFGRRGQI